MDPALQATITAVILRHMSAPKTTGTGYPAKDALAAQAASIDIVEILARNDVV